MSKPMTTLDLSPTHYLNIALTASENQHPLQALNYIDLSISLATDKHAYIFKKIEFLYEFHLYAQCTDYIVLHFPYLYHHCSLEQFAKVLSYYHQCTQCLTEELNHLLLAHNIPIILSTLYKDLTIGYFMDFEKKVNESYHAKEYDLCVQYAALFCKQTGGSQSVLELKALAHESLGQLNQAIKTYQQCLAFTSAQNAAPIYFSLGKVCAQAGLFGEAHFYFGEAITLSPDLLEYAIHDADCLFKWSKFALARRSFRLITQRFPNDAYSYLRLGELYELSHNNKLSRYYYKQARLLKKHGAHGQSLRSKWFNF
ncbi:MAG: hypothetical protein ACRCTE_00235 [Cellulosilyticaceae bacterium]